MTRLGQVSEEGNDVPSYPVYRQVVGLQFGKIEHLVDHFQELVAVALDKVFYFIVAFDLAGHAFYYGQWGAKFMCNIGVEPALELIHFFESLGFFLFELQAGL